MKVQYQLWVYLVCVAVLVNGFDEFIFEDEDIYNQALPPKIETGISAPGTKWCGPGTTASNYEDLGTQIDTDKCCRTHDHCAQIIEAQSSAYGLQNPDWFPILSCKCEQEFLNCLQHINNMISNTLGRLYFGTRSKCFAQGYPVIDCREYQNGTFRKRCIRYNVNENQSKIWQYYDIPFYSIKNDSQWIKNNVNKKPLNNNIKTKKS